MMKIKNALLVILLATLSNCGGKVPVAIPDISICAFSCQSDKAFCAKLSNPNDIIEKPLIETPVSLSIEDYASIDNFVKEIKKYFRDHQAVMQKIVKKYPELLNELNIEEKKMLGCFGAECPQGDQ